MKELENILKNLLLKLLLFFYPKKESNEEPIFEGNAKLLFIRLNRIGDALVTTPLFKIIKDELDCHISVLADKNNYFIFENSEYVDEVIIFRKGLRGYREVRKLSKEKKNDALIDLHDDVSTTVTLLAAIVMARYKFALKKSNANVYTHTVNKLDPSENHVIDRVLQLSKLFKINKYDKEINVLYSPSDESIKKCNAFISQNFNEPNFLLGINISSGSEARFWGSERYIMLLDYLEKYKIDILILSSPDDVAIAKEISRNKFTIFHTQDFDEFAAMISKLNFLFTPDTAVIHIASAFEVPVFGIYVKYDTTDMIWSPYRSKFDCVITEDADFAHLGFEEVIHKFNPFFEKCYHG